MLFGYFELKAMLAAVPAAQSRGVPHHTGQGALLVQSPLHPQGHPDVAEIPAGL